MNYDYRCNHCLETWEESQTMANRDVPCGLPCPHCGSDETVSRYISTAPTISYDGGGVKSVVRRAGSGWNDVLNKVKKASGRDNNIQTL